MGHQVYYDPYQPPQPPPQSIPSIYSSSAAANTTYIPESTSSYLTHYSSYFPTSAYSHRTSSSYLSSATTPSSFPSQALYNHSTLRSHVLGQTEAWQTSGSFAKRPKLESTFDLPVYPQRHEEMDFSHYKIYDGGIPDWKESLQMPLASIPSEAHPERPGEPDCPYFLKTQKCKFGLNCKFNHPKDILCTSGKTDAADLPERPSEPLCSFYVKTGKCKFGATCKFHHPKDIQIPSDRQEVAKSRQSESAGSGNCTYDRSEVKTSISDPAPSFNSKGLPMRLGEVDCPFYMKTGSCTYAVNCRYNHPDVNVKPPAAMVGHPVLTSPMPNLLGGLVNPAASILHSFQPSLAPTTFGLGPVIYPQRPGENECDYYMKTGVCKYGRSCKFHHPFDRAGPKSVVKLTLGGLPRREGVIKCPFYMKTGACKYAVTCKFDHPPPGEVIASTGNENSTKSEEAIENGNDVETPVE